MFHRFLWGITAKAGDLMRHNHCTTGEDAFLSHRHHPLTLERMQSAFLRRGVSGSFWKAKMRTGP